MKNVKLEHNNHAWAKESLLAEEKSNQKEGSYVVQMDSIKKFLNKLDMTHSSKIYKNGILYIFNCWSGEISWGNRQLFPSGKHHYYFMIA